ncbi:hypothetical protein LTR15_004266 [Elasticomyces elasticus]|nr:hypothetical protein LTR15_004266 [Elasticomyces elasticus]
MISKATTTILPVLILGVILLARPAFAFGAGNIASASKIEGQNWRHGDIEDVLLTLLTARAMGGKKFSKLDVKRVYFGNWLRDYSQAVDVGTVKNVSAEAIRLLLWILGFMSFGYGTGEFEVTKERLGCYRPEEHIDNPKDYADNIDARKYDRRLRGPVDERKELSIDERTGLKHYIATEDLGITTSAEMIRKLFRKSIELGRRYTETKDENDFYEALRLLGTGCHCLEDFSAHSNYTELALIELGERNVFPHVGRRTQVQIQGARQPVYPIVTGTFGGVDFLHSVCGELSDKTTQSEIQELEGTIEQSQNQDTSLLKSLLSQLPSGILGGDDHAGKADQLQANAQAARLDAMHITPKEPEAFTQQAESIARQIYPILEFHDNLIKNISEAIEKIPILPDLIEQLQEQVNIFVLSLIAPIMLPIINQVKAELSTGSSEIIQSSRDKQLIVFHDDNSSDPTHSMLSKDHFTNILNEPAGKVAASVIKWVVPQIVACWDDPSIDIRSTNDRIIHGVFHHPAQREMGQGGSRDGRLIMFQTVERWWNDMDDRARDQLRQQLSREGVQSGKNHKEGVQDKGHGCGRPMGLPGMGSGHKQGSAAPGAVAAAQVMGSVGDFLTGGGDGRQGGGSRPQSGGSRTQNQISNTVGEAVGGGALGGIVGALAGGLGGSLLGGAFGEGSEKKTYQSSQQGQDGYTSRIMETGHQPASQGRQERFGQAEVSKTQFNSGGYREEYQRYEQDGRSGQTGYGVSQSTEVRPQQDGGYSTRTERRVDHPSGTYDTEIQEQRVTSSGRQYAHEEKQHGNRRKDDSDDDDDEDDDEEDYEKRERKRKKKEEKRMKKLREQQGSPPRQERRRSRSRSQERQQERRSGEGYGRQQQSSEGGSGYGRQAETSSYGQSSYGRDNGRSEEPSYGRQQEPTYQQSSYGGGRDEQRQPSGYGGGASERQQYGGNTRSDYGGDGGRSQAPPYQSSYGGGQEEQRQQSNYGDRNEQRQQANYGDRHEQREQSSYGGDSYGGGQQYRGDEEQSSGYAESQQQRSRYGERKEESREDEGGSGYGQGGGYGQGRY